MQVPESAIDDSASQDLQLWGSCLVQLAAWAGSVGHAASREGAAAEPLALQLRSSALHAGQLTRYGPGYVTQAETVRLVSVTAGSSRAEHNTDRSPTPSALCRRSAQSGRAADAGDTPQKAALAALQQLTQNLHGQLQRTSVWNALLEGMLGQDLWSSAPPLPAVLRATGKLHTGLPTAQKPSASPQARLHSRQERINTCGRACHLPQSKSPCRCSSGRR